MAVRTTVSAAAVLTAAAAVYALVCRERRLRRLRRVLVRERVSHRLVSGRLVHDLDAYQRRLAPLLAQQAVLSAAGLVLDESLARHEYISPPTEGGPR